MFSFSQVKSLQKFASVHTNAPNHFNSECQLTDREAHKIARSAELAEWQNLIT